jgi:chromosomal replication initiation ATPase DnaA
MSAAASTPTSVTIIQQAWDQADRAMAARVRIEARERIAPDVLALVQPAAQHVSHDADVLLEERDETLADEPRREGINGDAQTLENFLVGDSNRIAFGLAHRLAMGGGVAKPTWSRLSARTASARRTC